MSAARTCSARRFSFSDTQEGAMQVTGLFHVAIKTNDLDATVKFYTECSA